MDGDSDDDDDDDDDDVAATPRRSCGLELTGEWPTNRCSVGTSIYSQSYVYSKHCPGGIDEDLYAHKLALLSRSKALALFVHLVHYTRREFLRTVAESSVKYCRRENNEPSTLDIKHVG
jgi:hypothetical protein